MDLTDPEEEVEAETLEMSENLETPEGPPDLEEAKTLEEVMTLEDLRTLADLLTPETREKVADLLLRMVLPKTLLLTIPILRIRK